ncbi:MULTISPECIES: peptide MFS transporter [unclassified Spirosoma]|uniref:peptide MFS transporter n=1 Tax=unclassified Spirosoma TaxID=2621999 RepID=UPI0009697237|nr:MULTISPECIES: peptide MFS transporter [unclassified Spirosoma]MBN8824942.1 peptide MFS transporter [Spirosoma sp.]OJW74816.1 MAG: MFS transporter [Spirosoma sp. 48-14]
MEAIIEKPQNTPTFFGHPIGLFVLFFTEMWERFSYYGMRAILLLFLIDKVRGGLGLNETEGAAIYGIYTASVYLLSLPGGWIADTLLGQRKSIWYGGLIIMLGHIILAIPAGPGLFYTGLCVVAMGTGLLKPNISSIVGELYPEGGARKDAGFSIFYMGINLGSLIGISVVGYLGQRVGWHYGFGAAAVAMGLGLITFQILGQRYLGDHGKQVTATTEVEQGSGSNRSLLAFVGLLIGVLLILQWSGVLDMTTAPGLAQAMGTIICLIAVSYFVYILVAGGLDAVEKKRVAVLFVFFMASALFWAGNEQQGSSLQIFADRYTDLNFFGWMVPSSWFQNLNPAFILTFSPVLASLWVFLANRKIDFSVPAKFATSLLLLGLAYVIMVFASRLALSGVKTSPVYLSFTYLFFTLGELFLSPVGLSAFSKLAPRRYTSQLMGLWFVGTSLGNLIAGLFAGGFDEKNVQQMPSMFQSVAYFSLGFGLLLMLLARPLKKWMGGVQ